MVKEEDLRARYTEYKGSSTALDKDLENRIHVSESASKISTDPRPEEVRTTNIMLNNVYNYCMIFIFR